MNPESTNPTIPDEFLEPIEKPNIISSLTESPIVIPDVDQELLELIRESPVTIDESDRFEFPKPGLPFTQGKTNRHDTTLLFDVECLPNVISYETCERLYIKVRKKPKFISVVANKTRQEIGGTIEPMTSDVHYYEENKQYVVPPYKYDIILGKKQGNQAEGQNRLGK